MAAFPGVDYLDFDSLLTEEQKLVRQTVRDFVDDRVMPIIECDHCPDHSVQESSYRLAIHYVVQNA